MRAPRAFVAAVLGGMIAAVILGGLWGPAAGGNEKSGQHSLTPAATHVNHHDARHKFELTLRVTYHPGGSIVQAVEEYITLRDSGGRLIVDGRCMSACTLFFGILPKDRYCATPTASFGFHTARKVDPRIPIVAHHDSDATEFIWALYPEPLRKLIRVRGWNGDDPTKPHLEFVEIYLEELNGLVPVCEMSDW